MANTLARPYALSSALRTPLLRCFASVSLAKPFFSRTISEKVRVLCQRELQIRGLWCSRSRYQGYLAQSFSIRATQVSESGSIDPPMIQSMEKKIKEHLNAEEVTVKDAYGDGRHVSIDVISSAFEGESAVNRQRMVYKAISEELQSTVHAVDQMSTRTPSEAASQQ